MRREDVHRAAAWLTIAHQLSTPEAELTVTVGPLAITAAVALAATAGLHAAWAAGSSWPAADRRGLADAVTGTPVMPDPPACWAVAVALTAAAAVTAGAGRQRRLAVFARAGVSTALLIREATGLTGRTHLLVAWTPSPRFVRLDRYPYGPLCAVVGALTATSLHRRPVGPGLPDGSGRAGPHHAA